MSNKKNQVLLDTVTSSSFILAVLQISFSHSVSEVRRSPRTLNLQDERNQCGLRLVAVTGFLDLLSADSRGRGALPELPNVE